MLSSLWAFLQLTRPAFLLGGALLYGLGAALAAASGASIDWSRYALGQAIVTSIQLATHYANEYFDRESDRLVGASRTWFSGGSGVLPEGRLSPLVALNAGRIGVAVALTLIVFALTIEPAMSAIGALALLGSWFYSAPPIRLTASGFGEWTTALIVAFLAPLSGVVMQRGSIDARLIAVTLPLVLIHVAMLLTFEFPDFDADSQTGKRTLAVRLGRRRAGQLHNALLASAFVVVWLTAIAGWIDVRLATWTLIAAPLAAWQLGSVARHARQVAARYWLLAAGGLGTFTLTAAAFLAGLLWR
jgi:1,4-dihydroxy-2-naphthoate octaprenyltransferase